VIDAADGDHAIDALQSLEVSKDAINSVSTPLGAIYPWELVCDEPPPPSVPMVRGCLRHNQARVADSTSARQSRNMGLFGPLAQHNISVDMIIQSQLSRD